MSTPSIALVTAQPVITLMRPKRSDSTLAGMIANATIPVVADTARVAPATEIR